uniref:Uncharacterized protein n=1 Tax=Rhizophora mucronata TaxID=61149 RepID=A0A2P2N853_RHIMU
MLKHKGICILAQSHSIRIESWSLLMNCNKGHRHSHREGRWGLLRS